MAFVPLFFTGFEDANIDRYTHAGCLIVSGTKHSGDYGLQVYNYAALGSLTFSFTGQNELYFGTWINSSDDSDNICNIYFYLNDGTYLKIMQNSSHKLNLAINNSTVVASGAVQTYKNSWFNLQGHIIVNDTTGLVETFVDGLSNFSYSGDTKPGTGTMITSIKLVNEYGSLGAAGDYYDDFVVGTGDWPGDLRVEVIVPNGDSSVQWTRSAGATDASCLDEIPNSDTDYISTTGTGKRDILNLSNWNSVGKTPLALSLTVRMNRDTANADTIKYGLTSNGTESTVNQALSVTPLYYTTLFNSDPDAAKAWTPAAIDALQLVLESVIA